jgi:hypothetical protein
MPTPTWFILGREPQISAAEIKALFPSLPTTFHPPFLTLTTESLPPNLINRLGGTIKIAREITPACTPIELETVLQTHLEARSGKIIFGLSWYSSEKARPKTIHELEALGKKLKKNLQEHDRSVRYVPNRDTILSSVTVTVNNLTRRGVEFIISDDGSGHLSVAESVAVQHVRVKRTGQDHNKNGGNNGNGQDKKITQRYIGGPDL